VTASLSSQTEVLGDALWELGEIALDLGDYEQARSRFRQARLDGANGYRLLLESAAGSALQGNVSHTETLLTTVDFYATAISLKGNSTPLTTGYRKPVICGRDSRRIPMMPQRQIT
jgi:hypothetical protein